MHRIDATFVSTRHALKRAESVKQCRQWSFAIGQEVGGGCQAALDGGARLHDQRL